MSERPFSAENLPAIPIICAGCGRVSNPSEADDEGWTLLPVSYTDRRRFLSCPRCNEWARFFD